MNNNCPYCGSNAWLEQKDTNGAKNFKCSGCQSTSPKSTYEEDDGNDAEILLNSRPIEDELRAEIERQRNLYFNLADAIAKESSSPQQLIDIARQTRLHRDKLMAEVERLKAENGRYYDTVIQLANQKYLVGDDYRELLNDLIKEIKK